ncbi:MAG: CbbQ/NirQ/NorQ/GpvN family protein [Thermodesulfobacteriota bacterium]
MKHPLVDYLVQAEPYYRPVGREIGLFLAAAEKSLPVLLKGPTGCGKTRFLEAMAWRLGRPLITVAGHEDLTASDLVGRWLFKDEQTVWMDGPLTLAVRHGAVCYLDEIVEARQDTTVVIHPLTDHRRLLTVEKKGEVLEAHPDFLLVLSYNPGYQSLLKELKTSTRQRFVALDFDYPPEEDEVEITATEAGLDRERAVLLVRMARRMRGLKEYGLEEGVSTRLVIYAGRLAAGGLPLTDAVLAAMISPVTDDPDLRRAMSEVVRELLPPV